MTDTRDSSGMPGRPQIADSDAKRTEPLNVRVARLMGWTYIGMAEHGLPEGDPPKGHPLDFPRRLDQHVEIPDYEHDPAFFLRLQVANGLCVEPDSQFPKVWIVCKVMTWPIGEGPDPIHAALDWAERAKAAGVVVKWEV